MTLEPKLTPERVRLPLLAGGALALLITSLYSDSAYIWSEPFASIPFAALIGLMLDRRPRRPRAARRGAARRSGDRRRGRWPLVVVAASAGSAGRLPRRPLHAGRGPPLPARRRRGLGQGHDRAADRRRRPQRRLQPVHPLRRRALEPRPVHRRELAAGDFRSLGADGGAGKCPQFVEAVNEGDYDYVVTTPELDLNDPRHAKVSPEGGWLSGAGRRGGPARRARLGLPDRAASSTRRLRPAPGPAEMTGTGEYLLGMAALAAVAVSMAIAGRTLRRALLPGWTGAPALLAAGVLALGVAGRDLRAARPLRHPGRGAADDRLRDRRRRRAAAGAAPDPRRAEASRGSDDGQRDGPRGPELELWVAIGFALLVAVQWAGPTLLALDRGIYGGDSLWYHMPFAAHIAETGSVTELLFTDPLYLNWLYPQNSELLHADGLMLLGDDFLSPLLNLGWLGAGAVRGLVHRPPLRGGRARGRGGRGADVGQPALLAPAGQRQQRRRRDRAAAGLGRDPGQRPLGDRPRPAGRRRARGRARARDQADGRPAGRRADDRRRS